MTCNVSVVHQAMASAIAQAQPNKAPPQPSSAHLSLSSNSKSKPFKPLRSSQYSFTSTFSPSRPQTVVPFRPSRVPNFLYGLVHVAAGDLLRAELASGSENGRRAREYMEQGELVPDEIVVRMVKDRLLQPDSQEKGWLLDGYPRSSSQAIALKELGFKPDLFVLIEINGSLTKEDVFVEIDSALTRLVEKKKGDFGISGGIEGICLQSPAKENTTSTCPVERSAQKMKISKLHSGPQLFSRVL